MINIFLRQIVSSSILILYKTCFLDSIDTVTSLQLMQALVKLSNIYIGNCKSKDLTPSHSVLAGIAKYLTKMLKIFGANQGDQDIGFALASADGSTNVSNIFIFFIFHILKNELYI